VRPLCLSLYEPPYSTLLICLKEFIKPPFYYYLPAVSILTVLVTRAGFWGCIAQGLPCQKYLRTSRTGGPECSLGDTDPVGLFAGSGSRIFTSKSRSGFDLDNLQYIRLIQSIFRHTKKYVVTETNEFAGICYFVRSGSRTVLYPSFSIIILIFILWAVSVGFFSSFFFMKSKVATDSLLG
jgi:hypothetical protein